MAGIYIHIPFCTKACHYCDFHFSTSLKIKSEMVDALCLELKNRTTYLGAEAIKTIYFGGGTPSLLTKEELKKILDTIYTHYNLIETPEITLEANPDDLNEQKLKELKEAGINRLSIGIQSFDDDTLKWMNRSHNTQQSLACIEMAQNIGLSNISIDLIYGLPKLSNKAWKEHLKQAIELKPTHISAYCLTVEEKTVLAHQVTKGEINMPTDDVSEEQFQLMINQLAKAGYEQYEISNFCLTGFESKHNSSYWKGKKYLGIGPSAHSYDGKSRRWNVANNHKYLQGFNGTAPNYWEDEIIDETTAYNEYILTSLRTKWGVSSNALNEKFNSDLVNHFQKEVYYFIKNGLVEITPDDCYVLSEQGKFLADGIASDLFWVE